MKNDSHPLIQALKFNAKPTGPAFAPMEGPRTFEINHEEIPGLPGKRVGEKITVSLEGHIHSQNNDGKTMMHVASVKPDSDEMTAKQNPGRVTNSKSGSVADPQ